MKLALPVSSYHFLAKAAQKQIIQHLNPVHMRWMSYALALLFLCLTVHLGATKYYIDSSDGDNSKDGLTPENAWKTLQRIRDSGPEPGDTFLLQRGEIWEGVQLRISHSGLVGQPIVYGAYGGPAEPLPIISGIDTIPGTDLASNWMEMSDGIWQMELPRTPNRLFLDGMESLRSDNFVNLGVTDSLGSTGAWFFADSTLFIVASENPAIAYSSIVGSIFFQTAPIEGADHIVIQDLDLRGASGASLFIAGCNFITVQRCSLGWNANSGLTIIDFKPKNQPRMGSSNIVVTQNTFNSNFTFFYGNESERGCGDGMKLFYWANNCEVYGNTFINWAHNAVELLADTDFSVGVTNNKIYDNYITAPDIPYAHPLGMDGFLDKCRDNEFYRNFIDSCRTTSQVNGNNNWVHHNIVVGMRNSPNKVNGTAFAFAMGVYDTLLVSQNNRFDHNLIINTEEAAFQIRSFGWDSITRNHQIRNNILYEVGQNPKNGRYSVGTGIELYDPDTTGVGGNTFQNNLFYNSLSDSNFVFVRDSSTHYSVAAFNALNGVDTNTISGNSYGDPLFTGLANGNYRPQQGSPAIDAGLDLGYALDYDQMPRLEGAAPDIGPFETNYPDPCIPIEGDSLVSDPIVLAAMDSIVSGTYSSIDTLDLTGGTVYTGDSVVMRAREHLVFRPGFSVEAGASFTAQVADLCDPAELMVIANPVRAPEPHLRRTNGLALHVFPNPATTQIQAGFTLTEEGPVRLTLINLQGQRVQRVYEAARQAAGEYRLDIPLGQERAGLYVLMLEHAGKRVVQRVVVQRE